MPLRPVIIGRYRDESGRMDGRWHFTHRHMITDLVGNLRDYHARTLG